MKWIIKKIINFALPTKWMYFMFFKYKRNAYFIIKQHGLLVAVRAGFMHYSLLKIFINSKIVWWCSCPSSTLSPRGSEGISNPKLAFHMVLLAVELWEIPAHHPVTASYTLTCSLQRDQLAMAKPWLQTVFLQANQPSPDITVQAFGTTWAFPGSTSRQGHFQRIAAHAFIGPQVSVITFLSVGKWEQSVAAD